MVFVMSVQKKRKSLTFHRTRSYSTLCLSCTLFLAWQMEQFKANGGTVAKRMLNSLQEVDGDYNIVVNCTGLGSKELVNDQEMYPVREQVVMLKTPWVKYLKLEGNLPTLFHMRKML